MNRSHLWAALGAAAGLCLALIIYLPARWLQPWVADGTQQHVQWVNTSGSIWQGQTQWRLTGGDGSADQVVVPGMWSWTLRPTWQQGPAVLLALSAPCCLSQALQLQLRWAGGGSPQWQVNDITLRLPLQILRGLGTPWNTLQLDGQMALHTTGLQAATPHGVQGQMTLDAEQVASRLSTVRPLGNYQATIQWPPQQLPQVQLRTLDGHLQLEGQGQIAQGRLRFRGQASASPDSEGALANLLNIIGRRRGSVSVLTIG